MNRTVKDAAVKTSHHEGLESLKVHVPGFVIAHNFAKHLKALKWESTLPEHLRRLEIQPLNV